MPDAILFTGASFGDLLLELAVELGLARLVNTSGQDQAPTLPTDGSILFKLKQRLNAGYMSFLGGINPSLPPGRKPYTHWSFLSREVTLEFHPDGLGPLNIDQDSTRYRLPDGITSAPKQAWTINTGGRYSNTHVQSVTWERVRHELAMAPTLRGCPVMAACRTIDALEHPDHGKAWETRVYPPPADPGMSMKADFRIQARPLNDLNQRHIAGTEHDRTIIAYALVEWHRRDDKKGDQFGRAMKLAGDSILASIELDKRARPMVVGQIRDPSVGQVIPNRGLVAAGQTTAVTYTPGIQNPGV